MPGGLLGGSLVALLALAAGALLVFALLPQLLFSQQAWPGSGDVRSILPLDLIQSPRCLQLLLRLPHQRAAGSAGEVSPEGCPEAFADGQGAVLDLQGPFLLQGGLKQWVKRWSHALSILAESPADTRATAVVTSGAGKPVYDVGLASYAKQLQQLGAAAAEAEQLQSQAPRPLHLELEGFASWRRGGPGSKDTMACPYLGALASSGSNACSRLVEMLFQEFGWVDPVLGAETNAVDVVLNAGPAGSTGTLKAEAAPWNLLAVLGGRQRVSLWPPQLAEAMPAMTSGGLTSSRFVGEADVFDGTKVHPAFEAVRRHNTSVVLVAGDVLQIPAGWHYVVENLQLSLAVTMRVQTSSLAHTWRKLLVIVAGLRRSSAASEPKRERIENLRLTDFMSEGKARAESAVAGDDDGSCSAAGGGACPPGGGAGAAAAAAAGFAASKRPTTKPEWVMLYAAQSKFQAVSVWHSTEEDSRYLLLDNDVQLTSRGEFVYHEMMAFVPLAAAVCNLEDAAGNQQAAAAEMPQLRVFVFGAGDAGVIKRMLQYPGVAHVHQVEIDELVLNVSRRFFPELQPPLGDRFQVTVGDGVKFAHDAARGDLAGTFDIVLLDTTDALVGDTPSGKELTLFTTALYKDLSTMLKPGGVLIQNAQSLDRAKDIHRLREAMSGSFSSTAPYMIVTPDYISPYFALLASNGPLRCPQSQDCARRLELKGAKPRYWTPAMHEASFVMPAILEPIQKACERAEH
eukprot:TRINITY_DN12689_c0_g2_i1.p1 TRINITY_DN12689_c0_g2~~TRINITY_DN12689_c0_g2_i1.p1  ORF type:complete len:741 (+),score=180.56 TRINITY_DN12689_c0_g2_i1:167-2389(+)